MCLLVIAATEYQIQVCIPAHNRSEFVMITSLYSIRLKIGWMAKIALKTFLQIQENWAGRNSKLNVCVSIHCSSRMQECKDESEIYNYQQIRIMHDI